MSNNKLSNLSYTNKDFNSIYVELLEYVKKLSSKWDPSESNESDPGLVLLKLAAIIGDKDSYNIDKNVLELMPASVSQLPAARQLFDQCGYSMRHYQAATGFVNFIIKKELEENETQNVYTLPAFTMFADSDDEIVYTSTQPMTMQVGTEYTVPVIEGTVVKYTVNNDPLITMQNIDSDNRLYFSETNIAENGIFISNVGDNEVEWTKVDNLQTRPKGDHCYKFGITLDTENCYIEFPQDVELLIGEGLNINYILTSGANGNVSVNKLNKFYVDTSFEVTSSSGETSYVKSDKDSVTIRNSMPIVNGLDPETIDEAYDSYKRVRDTFNTLVSLKDYSDYLVTSETASNGFVCDRTNDIQHSYKVLTTAESSTFLKTHVEKVEDGLYTKVGDDDYVAHKAPSMEPFDLCVYALEYVPSANTASQFNKSYQIVDLSTKSRIGKSILKNIPSDLKSIQHNIKGFDAEKILMIKNKYAVKASIIPRYPLSTTEKYQVLYNVETALYNALSSSKMTFGKEADIFTIQDVIINADQRIKTIVDFISPEYETYAVYKSHLNEIKEMRIDFASDNAGFVKVPMTAGKYNSLNTNLYFKEQNNTFVPAIEVSDGTITYKLSYDSSKTYYEFDGSLADLWNDFRAEIFAKNVLSGVTSLYTDDNKYTLKVTYDKVTEHRPVLKLSSNLNLEFASSGRSRKSPVLKENENILLTAPNFVTENNFSTYVKVLYFLNPERPTEKIERGSKCELVLDKEFNEFIVFFWKPSDSTGEYNFLKYDGSDSSLAKYISPSGFDLPVTQNLSSSYANIPDTTNIKTFFEGQPTGIITSTQNLNSEYTLCTTYQGKKVTSIYDFVNDCLISSANHQVLTGTEIINMMNLYTIHINNNENGCSNIYWILNNNNSNESTLFSSGISEYTLQSGEYLLYTNDDKSMLYVLGQGTLLQRTSNDDFKDEWTIQDPISYEDLAYTGISILDDKWFTLKKISKSQYDPSVIRDGLWATEQQQVLIGPNNEVILNQMDDSDIPETKLNSTTWTELSNFKISYQEAGGEPTNIENIYSTSSGWKCKSLLNIDISKTKAQPLVTNQSVTIITEDNSNPDPIEGNDASPKYLISSDPIVSLGGQTIDVASMYNSDVGILEYTSEEEPLGNEGELYEYTDKYDASSFVIIQIPKEEDESSTKDTLLTLTFQLLNGEYLLQVHSSVPEAVTNLSSTTLVSPDAFNRINNSDTYRINISSDVETVSIDIALKTRTEPITISIPPLFKYKKDILSKIDYTKGISSDSNSTFEEEVLAVIKKLDEDEVFNYTNVPATPIVNPLVASEFFKKQHFYNSYTIPQWNTEIESNVVVKDVVR